jgi:uncharacterized protein (UPF0332 family)
MPSKGQHLSQAIHNRNFYDALTDPGYLDWSVNALFYSALHYVDAYLDTKGYDPNNHDKRLTLVASEHNLKKICFDYLTLKDESEAGRYRIKHFNLEEVKGLELTCDKIKAYIESLF